MPAIREDLLHYVWKHKKLPLGRLYTTANETVHIVDTGTPNLLAGPDFFNAKIRIGGQLWAGNVEVHVHSADWYAHHHEKDPNYGNVILHVVWQENGPVFRKDNTVLPTLELREYVSPKLLKACETLLEKRPDSFINCGKDFLLVDPFLRDHWLERLYFDRLQRKAVPIQKMLDDSRNDWEKVLFALLLKNFGSKVNGTVFSGLAQRLDFGIVRKNRNSVLALESLFFGLLGLLETEAPPDAYRDELRSEYSYLRHKYGLDPEGLPSPGFFGLRPPGFPTVRLSQLANLYHRHENLFDKVMGASDLEVLYRLFDVKASAYWTDHFVFGKPSRKSAKRLTRKFVDLIVVNTILPLRFCYFRKQGQNNADAVTTAIMDVKAEENHIVSGFKGLGLNVGNAMESQALLQLYHEYCTKNRCLHCAIGNSLLSENG